MNSSRLANLRITTILERTRQSLFVIPGICLVVGMVLAEVLARLDRAGAGSWLPDSYETSSDDARAVLSAIATGTITVVTLVLTLTLVAIQLASGQLSPRTIINFLGDRFQQATVGVVLGTATLSLFALRSLRVVSDSSVRPADLTVLTAVVATLASLTMLVISVDRTARRLAVGNLLHDIAKETSDLVKTRYGSDSPRAASELPARIVAASEHDNDPASTSVASLRAGWVQYVDEEAVFDALPPGVGVEFLRPVGTFVFEHVELVRIRDADVDEQTCSSVRSAIVIGDNRTMQQDVSFGLTRLTDIGLRALSPGINDPNTAREVVVRLAQVVLDLQQYELETASVQIGSRTVVRHGAPTHGAFARDAFDQVRHGAADDIATLRTMRRSIAMVINETHRRSLPGGIDELDRQRNLIEERLRALGQELDDLSHVALP